LNDLVAIDIEGKVGEDVVLNEEGREYQLSLETINPAPGFAEQIVGMKRGEEKEFTLPLAADFPKSEFAGKECLFKVKVSEIKEKHLPELNDDFAGSLGQGLETLAQLRERITSDLKAAAEREARNKLVEKAIEAVIGLTKLEFPPILVEQEIDRLIEEQLKRLGGISLEDFLRNTGKAEEEYRAELRPMAEKRVARGLILGKISEEEKIKVDEVELGAEIGRLAQEAGEKAQEIWQKFASPEARQSLRDEILVRKTIERLIEIATAEVDREPSMSTTEAGKEER